MGTQENVGIKNCLCLLHWKNISCISCYSFVCLWCVVPVWIH